MRTTIGNATFDRRWKRHSYRQRQGIALVLAVFLMTVLLGMVAFSVDIGYLAASKAELRRTADAAALAGCWQLIDSELSGASTSQAQSAMISAATSTVTLNRVCNQSLAVQTAGESTDIRSGYLASLSSSGVLSSSSENPFRAVWVRVQKTEQSNGEVPFYFAPVLGESGRGVTVTAMAAFATQIKGFNTPPSSGASNIDLLPFALDLQTWAALLAGGGTDGYSYNSNCDYVSQGADGIREVNLYPQGTGSPGNRGTVDIGGANNSTNDIARQIVCGISASDLAALGKPLVLSDGGTMTLNGDTGISAGVKDELASIIGEVRCIPIFSSVAGNGNNANYTIVRWVGVRIMAVKLTGSMSSKYVIVQPAPFIARNAVAGDGSRTWSDKVYSPVVLVQ